MSEDTKSVVYDWERMRRLAGDGRYHFGSAERIAENRAWFRAFQSEAREHGAEVVIEDGHVYVAFGGWHDYIGHLSAAMMGQPIECFCLKGARTLSDFPGPNTWELRAGAGGRPPWLVAEPTGDWIDGDTFGNEWEVRYAIVFLPADEAEDGLYCWQVYTDDGKGNGDFLADYPTLDAAINACDEGSVIER